MLLKDSWKPPYLLWTVRHFLPKGDPLPIAAASSVPLIEV